jgi:hypothetical protein
MQNFVFLAIMAGILCGIDAMFFHSHYRTAALQGVVYQGQAFTREVDYQLARAFR